MLNIDFSQKEFSNYEAMYFEVLANNGPTEDKKNENNFRKQNPEYY